MNDLIILQIMKDKSNFESYRHLIKDYLVDRDTRTMLQDYQAYFEEFKDHDKVDTNVFSSWYFQFRHPNMNQDKAELHQALISKIDKEVDEVTINKFKNKLYELDFATVITNMAKDYQDGKVDGNSFRLKVEEESDRLTEKLAMSSDVPWDCGDLNEVLDDLSYESGLKFRLKCMDRSIGSLHASKFVIVGAYVDSGKSTYLADLASYFAKQAVEIKDQWYSGRYIMWFNNEGSSKEIRMYCMQSAIYGSRDRIYQDRENAQIKYEKETGDLIKVIPCQGWHIRDIEREIKKYKPCVVIYDMLDNVQGFEGGETSDIRYRKLYDYARQMADIHNHVAIATSQCTGEANGVEQIEMQMLTGSRVAKQSTADLMIMIGRSLERGKENHRYMYCPKNKLTPQDPNVDRKVNTEVRFDGMRKRYLDPVEVG